MLLIIKEKRCIKYEITNLITPSIECTCCMSVVYGAPLVTREIFLLSRAHDIIISWARFNISCARLNKKILLHVPKGAP